MGSVERSTGGLNLHAASVTITTVKQPGVVMPRSTRVRRSLGAFLIAACLALLAAVPVSYAQTTSTPSTTVPTTTTESPADKKRDEDLAVLVLFFGGFLTASVLLYVWLIQRRYYAAAIDLQRRTGVLPEPEVIHGLVTRTMLPELDAAKIDGPLVVVVGQKTDYTALKRGLPVEATWTVEPGDLTKPLDAAKKTSSVTIEAIKKGTFMITATVDGEKAPPYPVTAIEIPPAETSSLPFVGEGYGSILVAVVILSLASVLALMGKFSSDAVATLFGAVAGYIFYRVQQGTGSSQADAKVPPS